MASLHPLAAPAEATEAPTGSAPTAQSASTSAAVGTLWSRLSLHARPSQVQTRAGSFFKAATAGMGGSTVVPLCLSPTSAAAAALFSSPQAVLPPLSPNTSTGIHDWSAGPGGDDVILSLPPLPSFSSSDGMGTSPPAHSASAESNISPPTSPPTPGAHSGEDRPSQVEGQSAPSQARGGKGYLPRLNSPTSIAAAHKEALEKRDRKGTQLSNATRNKAIEGLRINSSSTGSDKRSHSAMDADGETRTRSRGKGANSPPEVTLDFGLDLDGNVGYMGEDADDGDTKDSSSGEDGEKEREKQSKVFSHFSAHLHLFSYVLLLAGLRQNTSSLYRNWLRVVTYGCTAMCFANLFMRTKSYRNPLFDSVLVVLHILVCSSYEWWLSYCRSKEWRVLMNIVTQVSSQHFARHIRLLGWFGLIMVSGATTTIVLGWELPIFGVLAEHSHDIAGEGGSTGDYIFLIMHGVFMIVIIAPWAAVCMTSVCLFKLVVLAHQSDIEHHFLFIKHTLQQSLELLQMEQIAIEPNTGGVSVSRKPTVSSPSALPPPVLAKRDVIADCFRVIVKHHQAVRGRLRATCKYFDYLYLAYIVTSILLVFSAAMDFNHYAAGFPFEADVWQDSVDLSLFPHLVQDSFYMGVGLLGIYGCFYVTSDLSSSFNRFVRRINDLPMAFPHASFSLMTIPPSTLSGLVHYYRVSHTAYTLFGIPITFNLFAAFSLTVLGILFVCLWIVNTS